MTTRTTLWSLGLAALLCIGGASAAAQAQPDTATPRQHHGEIRAIDPAAGTLVVETSSGEETFTINESTRFADTTQRVEPEALVVGSSVVVQSVPDDANRWLVAFVQVVDPAELAAGRVVSDLSRHPAFAVADTATVAGFDAATGKLSVQTLDGPRAYQVDETTRIRSGADTLAPSDLTAGQRVAISAAEHDGMVVAKHITVVALGSEAPAVRESP